MFRIKRVYAPPAPEDGFRVLVDRIWPRGLSRDAAAIEAWLKEVAPSPGLRRWFAHDPARWAEFTMRYREELKDPERASGLVRLRREERERGTVTLLFAARNETHNHAVLLRDVLSGTPDRKR